MHPVQEHINTPGIDCSIQRLTECIEYERRNSYPTQSVTIKLRQHKSHTANTPTEKIGEYAGAGIKPTTLSEFTCSCTGCMVPFPT